MNFNEIFRKNVTDDIKSDTKTQLCTLYRSLVFGIYS